MPFTVEQFFEIFATYNNNVWPMQYVLVLLALIAIVLVVKKHSRSAEMTSLILSFFWIWIGVVYHLAHFVIINPAAKVFGALNIVQGAVFLYYGIAKSALSFRIQRNLYGGGGLLLIVYGLLVYPILGYSFGHVYPQSPTFGLPCPTTIFTFGILLLAERVPFPVLIIPFAWSLVGFTAALSFGVWEDTGLLIAGLAGTTLILLRNRGAQVRLAKAA